MALTVHQPITLIYWSETHRVHMFCSSDTCSGHCMVTMDTCRD